MNEVSSIVFAALGVLLVLAGLVVLIFRSRFAENMSHAGAGPSGRKVSTRYAVGIGAMQILLGISFLFAAAPIAEVVRTSKASRTFAALLNSLGGWAVLIAIFLIVAGGVSAYVGFFLIRRSWRTRSGWGTEEGLRIPRNQAAAILGGTVLLAWGGIAVLVGVLGLLLQ